jgi:hypothetical protein
MMVERNEFEAAVGLIEESIEAKRMAQNVLSSPEGNSFYGEPFGMGENKERELSCSAIVVHSSVAKLLSARRLILILVPIRFLC